MKVKNLIPAVLLALALSATFALADYDFVGEGSGICYVGGQGISPWANWDGTLYTGQTNNPFVGDWWHGERNGDINCYTNYNVLTGCYGVQNYGTWDCNQEMGLRGSFTGGFCPGSDTAGGTWWEQDNSCDGTWGGNLDD